MSDNETKKPSKKRSAESNTRPVSLLYKITAEDGSPLVGADGQPVKAKLFIAAASRNARTVVDALQADRDLQIVYLEAVN